MVCIWLSIPLLQLYLCYTAGATAMDKDTLLILRKIVDSQGKLKDWNASDDSPCGWSHVQCRDGSMNVTGLDLDDMSFVGTVPSILASLRSLESLVLSSNNFSGRIPVFLAFLPHLETLDLSDNSFSGPIPSSLANAKRLKTLRLEGNQLSGSLVRSLTSLNLELLEDLNLSVNRFSGPIPKQISKAQRLKKLQLYSNDLKGTIPSSFSELRSLELLYLFNNSLSGHIPDLTGLQNLTDLDLGYNQLSGQLSGVENLTSMQRFQFRHNFFSGKLPGFDRLKSTVVSLDFSDNLLEGEIPSAITSMPHLQLLDLSRNCLEGEIPPAITNLSNLQSINMSYNCLSGKIPTEIGSMPNLFTLVLSFNNLSGEIPAGIVAASSLLELNLASNRLVGGIPRRITEIAGLTDLNLAWNFLEGSIPPGPWSTETQRVDLSNNRLNGIFPFELLTKNLKFLNLSSNFLTGGIRLFGRDASDAYINLQSTKPEDMQLETLDLSNNLLQGDMSAMLLEKLPRLKELRLRDNMLWGDIPVGPRIWTGLQILDVSHNSMNLSATRKDTTLQIIFDTYTTLGELRLSNNVATGTLPSSSSKLHMLEVLDLSNSNLTGNLTEAFPIFTGAYLPALKVVNLSNNRLWGEIPPGFSEMLNLAYLDLSNNNLSGPVPELPNLKVNVSFFFSGGNRGLCSAPGLKPCPLPGNSSRSEWESHLLWYHGVSKNLCTPNGLLKTVVKFEVRAACAILLSTPKGQGRANDAVMMTFLCRESCAVEHPHCRGCVHPGVSAEFLGTGLALESIFQEAPTGRGLDSSAAGQGHCHHVDVPPRPPQSDEQLLGKLPNRGRRIRSGLQGSAGGRHNCCHQAGQAGGHRRAQTPVLK